MKANMMRDYGAIPRYNPLSKKRQECIDLIKKMLFMILFSFQKLIPFGRMAGIVRENLRTGSDYESKTIVALQTIVGIFTFACLRFKTA